MNGIPCLAANCKVMIVDKLKLLVNNYKQYLNEVRRNLYFQRLKEEYEALIAFINSNKAADLDWFRLESNSDGTRWFGKCWHYHNMLRYEFDVEFDIPVTYPTTAPEIALPELDGKTAKMYRGGRICLSDHFKPLWARNVPKFGIAQAFSLGLGPWLAVEVPDLVDRGMIQPKTA
ncbi:Ufm1-conjugating enzyme 1 [Wuchereria bancrofti]|uniref:Ubiquitin-fold modifier-conjugating enzyme 1 n=1 Tax=Wuchereria bancrofti TaxID=6293 RepID=J9E5X6_WUCBA|nr:Ufm1-conjugating enzyme 1 [Wuchereria bancrofti]